MGGRRWGEARVTPPPERGHGWQPTASGKEVFIREGKSNIEHPTSNAEHRRGNYGNQVVREGREDVR